LVGVVDSVSLDDVNAVSFSEHFRQHTSFPTPLSQSQNMILDSDCMHTKLSNILPLAMLP
jgi:hypothetical protein